MLDGDIVVTDAECDKFKPEKCKNKKEKQEIGSRVARSRASRGFGRAKKWHELTWTWGFSSVPTESEVLTHITVPLLAALGWQPEHIAIGWSRCPGTLDD